MPGVAGRPSLPRTASLRRTHANPHARQAATRRCRGSQQCRAHPLRRRGRCEPMWWQSPGLSVWLDNSARFGYNTDVHSPIARGAAGRKRPQGEGAMAAGPPQPSQAPTGQETRARRANSRPVTRGQTGLALLLARGFDHIPATDKGGTT